MEFSTDIKAKVIAQYIGQVVKTNTRVAQGEGKPFRFLKGQLKEIDMGMVDSFMGVLLENEKIETNHDNYNTNECKLILKPVSAITDEDALVIQKIYDGNYPPDYFPEAARINRGRKFANDPMLCYEAYQYLISKGYDIKHRLLGGLTLQQAGLAIYEEAESVNINDAIKLFSEKYSERFPEIIGVGCTNEQSSGSKTFHNETIVVDLVHKSNISEMPTVFMGIGVIYQGQE